MSSLEIIGTILREATALLIILDPLGGLPVFMALLREAEEATRRRTANLIISVTWLILGLAATIGRGLLSLFGVGLPEMLIGGGLLLMFIGIDLVFGIFPHRRDDVESAGIVPLATPLLAGPGAIVSVMLLIERHPLPFNYIITFGAVLLALSVCWIVFRYSDIFFRILGARGLLILTKLVGILVTGIGTHFVLAGWTKFAQFGPSAF